MIKRKWGEAKAVVPAVADEGIDGSGRQRGYRVRSPQIRGSGAVSPARVQKAEPMLWVWGEGP